MGQTVSTTARRDWEAYLEGLRQGKHVGYPASIRSNWTKLKPEVRQQLLGEAQAAQDEWRASQPEATQERWRQQEAEWEEDMERRHPGWKRLNPETRGAVVLQRLVKKMPGGDLIAQALDPVIKHGLEGATEFLVKGGMELAKAIITGNYGQAAQNIAKAFVKPFINAVTESHEELTPAAQAVRAAAAQISGEGIHKRHIQKALVYYGSGWMRGGARPPLTHTPHPHTPPHDREEEDERVMEREYERDYMVAIGRLTRHLRGLSNDDLIEWIRRHRGDLENGLMADSIHLVRVAGSLRVEVVVDRERYTPNDFRRLLIDAMHTPDFVLDPIEINSMAVYPEHHPEYYMSEDIEGVEPRERGEGFLANVFKFFTGKYQGEKALEKFLHKHGEARITSIRLFRQPVKGLLQKAVDWFTKGDLQKQMEKNAYDKLFHLSMYMSLSDGSAVTLEKNARITTHEGKLTYGVEAQSLVVFQGDGPELRTFIYKAIQRAGAEGFFVYDAFSRNCQDFITNALQANGLLDEPVKGWIQQNLRDVASKHPITAQFFTGITDLAGIVGGTTTQGAEGTDNFQLEKAMKGVKGFKGVVPLDGLPTRLKKGDKWIINYQPQTQGGSHWIGLCVLGDRAVVFDSFGVKPPEAVVALIRRSGLHLVANNSTYQMAHSGACGQFAVFFLTHTKDFDSLYKVLYEDLTPEPVLENEMRVIKFFKGLNKSQ